MGMQIPRAHEAGLRRVGVNPTENEQVVLDTVRDVCLLVDGLARVRCALLLRDEQDVDEQCIVDQRAAENAAHLQLPDGVFAGKFEETAAKAAGKEHGSERFAAFEVGYGAEGNFVRFFWLLWFWRRFTNFGRSCGPVVDVVLVLY